MFKVYFNDKYIGVSANRRDAVAGIKILTDGITLAISESDGELYVRPLFIPLQERMNEEDWAPFNFSRMMTPKDVRYRTDYSDDPQVVEAAGND